jgi:hypothetical protein
MDSKPIRRWLESRRPGLDREAGDTEVDHPVPRVVRGLAPEAVAVAVDRDAGDALAEYPPSDKKKAAPKGAAFRQGMEPSGAHTMGTRTVPLLYIASF